jgi:hypothetical protein
MPQHEANCLDANGVNQNLYLYVCRMGPEPMRACRMGPEPMRACRMGPEPMRACRMGRPQVCRMGPEPIMRGCRMGPEPMSGLWTGPEAPRARGCALDGERVWAARAIGAGDMLKVKA